MCANAGITQSCYLCGSSENITRDHVPPKGFFPPPLPSNLITMPCCERCNDSYKLEDEAFRVLVSALPNISHAGAWIQKNKVFEGTFTRSPKLARHVAASITPATDGSPYDTLTFPKERGHRFLTRIATGLLAHFYPEFQRADQIYEVRNFTMATDPELAALAILRDEGIYDERGDGVFQFLRDVSVEHQWGFWLFCFYEASMFGVYHKRGHAVDGPR